MTDMEHYGTHRNSIDVPHSSGPSIRMEIVETGNSGYPEMLRPAQVDERDGFALSPVANSWPPNLAVSTSKLHHHFCELVYAWNMNPFKRRNPDAEPSPESIGVAAVDVTAEAEGRSRFSFLSKQDLDDFLDHYTLDDFVLHVIEASRSDAFCFVELNNKFLHSNIEQFFTIYRDAMMNLTVVEEQRRRALVMDGNKVGHVFVDYYTEVAVHEMNRIKAARQTLGASGVPK